MSFFFFMSSSSLRWSWSSYGRLKRRHRWPVSAPTRILIEDIERFVVIVIIIITTTITVCIVPVAIKIVLVFILSAMVVGNSRLEGVVLVLFVEFDSVTTNTTITGGWGRQQDLMCIFFVTVIGIEKCTGRINIHLSIASSSTDTRGKCSIWSSMGRNGTDITALGRKRSNRRRGGRRGSSRNTYVFRSVGDTMTAKTID
mmetsp:Transcript_3017/g.6792  ORF Transcript_3017/g.6792 Transcript_3017/m.6792 type:complete len:200 (-) Transcript_3017:407-1006(-)